MRFDGLTRWRDRRRRLRSGQIRVLYCDDDASSVARFVERHEGRLIIESLLEIDEVPRRLAGSGADLPDAIILDLFHPIDADPTKWAAHHADVEAAVEAVRAALDDLRKCVDRGLTPQALDVLEELRDSYTSRDLPVLIRTRQGLNILRDEDLRRVDDLDAEWLIKDEKRISAGSERTRIRRVVRRARAAPRMGRDVRLGAVFCVASALLGALLSSWL
jgi:hypothetical protein